ncbi:Predicted N-acetyltransferase YhbS [Sphingomonas palmae]|uniref:Predicted N-acetyltransferase YhbS n=1 Tax=Sphingomonas palmae TaxID=1855283 RepID=A0A1H7HDN2_9SPHN|nr:N-acetyltransferase [Sphingomonas palmae]SEK48526.1 Predicted N-acetyltransferase YhbS [Sphingomonas palmae]
MIELVPIGDVEPEAVEQLLDRAFGTDRHRRTAYALRSGTVALPRISFAAIHNGSLVGTIQCWPIWFVPDLPDGERVPMTLMGPVAVTPAYQQEGIGRRLMNAALDANEAGMVPGSAALMLIGDPEYYARFFGFSAERTAAWRLPGPVERHRLLARGLSVPDASGTIMPRALTNS